MQPQFTAVPGAFQQPSNPFPGLQATTTGFLQPQMTSANPFRPSTAPQQAAGLSPFGQTIPLQPAPTGANPFLAQNGFPGTNPFPTINSTNPYPAAAQTTNPFPTVVNGNPFAALRDNSVPNAAGSNPFPSSNMNPFPMQSRSVSQPFSLASPSQPPSTNFPTTIAPAPTSMFNPSAPISSMPARPASTPLTRKNPSSPPPQPLKPHQTGSRNPFGVPKAPSPPPVPRLPTLFELASGAAQPQWQSQNQVQVKPQPTGLPTTTFASVASSFVTGSPGDGVQTSPVTSMGSSPTAVSPTSVTTASTTGSTFSASVFGSLGGQPTGSTALSSQPTGAPLRPQATGFNAGVKAFKPTSSFGASLLEALPPIPQSTPPTPKLEGASSAGSPPVGAMPPGGGFGSNFGLGAQPTGFPATGTGSGGLAVPGGGSSLGVGLRPQATGAANPFRASVLAPNSGAGAAGAFPGFSAANGNPGNGLFLQSAGTSSPFGQSLFVGGQTNGSKQPNGTASLI